MLDLVQVVQVVPLEQASQFYIQGEQVVPLSQYLAIHVSQVAALVLAQALQLTSVQAVQVPSEPLYQPKPVVVAATQVSQTATV